ncbi:spore germination protein [Clostridium cavendishii DSM 21758]|uniref:Spore germination protein n=1 Tax=Clostridium cavendishii DSM 21758 TaxID=1121302 RepID=A0A1M6Q4U8_9CLOT|nr:spore germination protein [Clostridium cavendishii]SHK15279.1 spore germination protein [Clostridium cavendishii DSM 21758]
MEGQLNYIKDKLKNSFDVKYREVDSGLGPVTLVFIDLLCSAIMIGDFVVNPLKKFKDDIKEPDDIITKSLNTIVADFLKDEEEAISHILSGDIVLIFKNTDKMIYCDVKGAVRRSVGIPITEAVIKGPREGFTEAFVDNIALIRRRIKSPKLKFEPMMVGKTSQTVVCIGYLDGVVSGELVNEVKQKVQGLDYDFILDTNYIEDELRAKKTIFDTVGYTEKPDEVSAKIMEGRVAIIVDGTPFVLTVPYFFLENFQTPDDYYTNKYFANFTRGLRWLAFFIAMFLPALYVAVITHHFSMIPSLFVFRLAVARAGVPFPTVVEVILMMVFFQLIKEAGLRLPQPIGTAMSIVAALILGDAAVGAGLASRITILIVAISTVCYFLVPRAYGAISLWSMGFVILSGFFGLPGFILGFLILVSHLSNIKSCNFTYLFPIETLKTHKFKDLMFRGDLKTISKKVIDEDDKHEKN